MIHRSRLARANILIQTVCMTEVNRIDSTSPDQRDELIARLRSIVPEAFNEGAVNLDRLAELVGLPVDNGPERYGLTWPGKRAAIAMLQAPSAATLVPDADESVNFDTAQHVFIEGENLEVLKLLYKSYFGQVKLIYIDPPYNTGSDFIYHDDFADPLSAYLRQTGQMTEEGDLTTSAPETSGRLHSNWLSMVYPRLSMARQMLKEEGVILISIDDIEVAKLRQLCDDVFGEENFVAQIVWEGAFKNDARHIGINHEYVLAYARNKSALKFDWDVAKDDVAPVLREVSRLRRLHGDNFEAASDDLAGWFRANKAKPVFAHRRFRNIDRRGAYKEDDPTAPGGRKFDLINKKTGQLIPLRKGRGWAFDQDEFDRLVDEERISFVTENSIMVRRYLHETDRVTLQSVIYQPARSASERLGRFLGVNAFDYPKDEYVLGKFVEMVGAGQDTSGIMMDFFAGSGAFADAVLKQNQRDGGSRQFIAVQLPEPISETQPAAEFLAEMDRPLHISELTKLRIRKCFEQSVGLTEQGKGFRTFRLGASNIRRWTGVEDKTAEGYLKQMEAFADTLVPGWKAEDVIWEVALREGFQLTASVTALVEGAPPKCWRVSDADSERAFTICLADIIDLDSVKPLGLAKNDLFICRDTALDDTVAANLALQCRLKVL